MKEDTTPSQHPSLPQDPEAIVASVRDRYGRIADRRSVCCEPPPAFDKEAGCCGGDSERLGYSADDLSTLPEGADLGLGCGAPVALLAAQPGETVLDLGSGPGLDALLAARAVGPEGRVIGVDMTPKMIARARDNARKAGATNVEFREGRLERLPVDDASIDAVISNCVINLVPDKSIVFREVSRVLRPGGRLVISDVVLDGLLPDAVASDLLAWAGCIAGAAQRHDYFTVVREAGLSDIEVLTDRDALGLFTNDLPAEIVEGLSRVGVEPKEIRGVVRSVTYRASKPA